MKKFIYIFFILIVNVSLVKATDIDVSCQFNDFVDQFCGGYVQRSGDAYADIGNPIYTDIGNAVKGVSGVSGDTYLGLRYDIITGLKSTLNEVAVDYDLNLSGVTNYTMAFWYILTDHSHHSGTGVFMSDDGGSSFTKIFDLTRDSEIWHRVQIDIDSLAAVNGLILNSQVVIRIKYAHDGSPELGTGVGIDNLVLGTSVCDNQNISISQSSTPHLGGIFLNGWYGTNGDISVSNATVLNEKSVIAQCGVNGKVSLGPGFICESGASFKASTDYSCGISFKSATVKPAPSFVDNKGGVEVYVYPNPSDGNINFKADKEIGLCKIQIVNIQGQILDEIEKNLGDKGSLDLTDLNPGVYLVIFKTETGLSTRKLTIN